VILPAATLNISRPEHTIIFSCEDLYHHLEENHMSRLKELPTGYDVTIVCYVRRQDKYIESACKQRIKAGSPLNLPRSLTRHTNASSLNQVHASYYRMMLGWERVFGRKAIVVRPLDANHFPDGDLLQDFLAAAGLSGIELFSGGNERSNEALPAELIAVLRVFNDTGIVPQESRNKWRACRKAVIPIFAIGWTRRRRPTETTTDLPAIL